MYDEQLLKTIILFQVCFLAYPLQAPIWLYVQKFEWLLLSVCTIPGIGLKVCQPFSIISPNPPPSQFATFPFAGSGRRDQEPQPLPSSISFPPSHRGAISLVLGYSKASKSIFFMQQNIHLPAHFVQSSWSASLCLKWLVEFSFKDVHLL